MRKSDTDFLAAFNEAMAKVIGGEPFKIVVAGNGLKVLKSSVPEAGAELKACSTPDLNCLILTSVDTAEVNWSLEYE